MLFKQTMRIYIYKIKYNKLYVKLLNGSEKCCRMVNIFRNVSKELWDTCAGRNVGAAGISEG